MPRMNQPNGRNAKYGVVLLLTLTASCIGGKLESPPPEEAAAGAGSGGQSAATGGASATSGTTSIGGARTTGGMNSTTSTGGTAATGGTSSTSSTSTIPCTVTTNLLDYRDTGTATANWIGGDPYSVVDNPCGVQGAIFAYSDSVPSATSPNPINSSPCASGKCCISGTTQIWTDGGANPTYKEWGAGIGLSLGDSGATTSVKSAYAGNAKGFTITTSGSLSGHELLVLYLQSATDESAPYKSFKAGTGIGQLSVPFSEATCSTWATACSTGKAPYAVMLQVAGGDTAGSFNLCLESITPLL